MVEFQVPPLFADNSYCSSPSPKVFPLWRPRDGCDHNIYASRGGSCIGVEHSAGSGTVLTTRQMWFNRLKAILRQAGGCIFNLPHFRISDIVASLWVATQRLRKHEHVKIVSWALDIGKGQRVSPVGAATPASRLL
jgi:hypothetical protein